MKSLLSIFLISCVSSSHIDPDRPNEGAERSDANLDPVSLITKYQYPAEEHQVVTEDGYILTLHRIPYGRVSSKNQNKGPVILQHGLFSSSVHWIITGTKKGLGYILADSGYDVWMPNFRGNSFSLGHTTYNTTDSKYWDFSWHEMGIYDFPAIFRYILESTGAEDISLIGHSQGTTAFLIFNIFHPEFTKSIRSAFLLSPISYMGHSRSLLLQAISRFYKPLEDLSAVLGIHSLVQQNDFLNKITNILCLSIRPINPFLCENALFLTTGFDISQSNLTMMEIVIDAGLYGSSVKQLIHYAQLIESNKFRQYDYGLRNYFIYGQLWPPEYDLKKVEAPVYIFYGQNDWLSDVKDVHKLMKELPNLLYSYLVPYEKFNHIDHLFGIDVVKLEYEHLMEILDSLYQ